MTMALITDHRTLPAPACKGGYPWTQITEFMDAQQVARLATWMTGQTQMLCHGETCHGRAHGPVVYPWDLRRFSAAGPVID